MESLAFLIWLQRTLPSYLLECFCKDSPARDPVLQGRSLHGVIPKQSTATIPSPSCPSRHSHLVYAYQLSILTIFRSNVDIDMTVSVFNLATLKQVKNSVIGNPTAKLALAQDDAFIRRCVFLVFSAVSLLM